MQFRAIASDSRVGNRNGNKEMELKGLKVKTITYSHGEYRLGSPAEIIDEGSFYRLDDTHIFDKHKIKEIRRADNRVEIEMTDKTVTLEVAW